MNGENHSRVSGFHPSLRAAREYAETKLIDGDLRLFDLVALNDAGKLDAQFPPIPDGTCEWCREQELIRDIGDLVCQACLSIMIEMMRAIVADDIETHAVLARKIDSRHTSGTIQ